MEIIIVVMIGFIIGVIVAVTFISKNNKIKKPDQKIYRKGIHICELTNDDDGDITATYEVGEISVSTTMSKVVVLQVSSGNTLWNNKDGVEKMKSLVHNNWIRSERVEWIEEDVKVVRNEKLSDILN